MIYITGDTHIPINISKLNRKNFPEQKNLSKEDYLIICGDFGGVWDNSKEDMYWRNWLDQKNFTTLFVDGNHENFDLLSTFEEVELFGGRVHKISDSVYHLMRGQIYNIDSKTFFTFGGASSHDKEHRTEGVSWWKEELPSSEELQTAITNLTLNEWKVDYIITHCAPSSVQQTINTNYDKDILTDFFEDIKTKIEFKKWFFGHYHTSVNVDDRFCCLYNKIEQLF